MQDSATDRRSDWFVRALGVVLAASLLHLALAHVLLSVLAPPNPRAADLRELINLTAVVTALAQLVLLYLRAQSSTPMHATSAIALALRVVPPIAALGLAPLIVPEADPRRLLAPATCATWAAAIMISIPVKRALHALAIRAPPAAHLAAQGLPDPPSLSRLETRIVAGAAFASSLLALGAWLPRAEPDALAPSLPFLGGLLFVLILAALAGRSLSESPGQDLVDIAGRLDAYGHDRPQAGRSRGTVAITSADQVGELLSELEALRKHLDEELSIYEDALDKTKAVDAKKSDFLHAVSHELRTPLGTVSGFAQLLLEGRPTPLTEAQSEDVRLIGAGARQLLELINDILDVSMIESGELRLEFSTVSLSEVCRDVVEIHRPLVRGREVTLEAELPDDLPEVECDRRRVTQILTNLISNAIKFTERGTVVVRAAYDAKTDRVLIHCIDTGAGIEPEDLDKIFEEYRQVGSVKRRAKGTGLGLSIARAIAVHHGGDLVVESSLGVGSTFTLHLPVTPPQRPSKIDMAERTAMARARRPRRTSREYLQ